ncbi:MAG: hypothetical protein V4592_07415 [Bacteroidota bacterium]
MALDFYHLNDTDGKELLFQLNNDDLNCLKNVFKIYKDKTGLYIDPYANIRIYQDHVELIIKLIEAEIGHSKNQDKLQSILNRFKQADAGLLATGD